MSGCPTNPILLETLEMFPLVLEFGSVLVIYVNFESLCVDNFDNGTVYFSFVCFVFVSS